MRTVRLGGRLLVFSAPPPSPVWTRKALVRKALRPGLGHALLARLRSFLDRSEPELVRLLVYTWRNQAKDVTYDEVETAIAAGTATLADLYRWQQAYAAFVVELEGLYAEAFDAAARAVEELVDGFGFDPAVPLVRRWIETRGGDLIVQLTTQQVLAIRQLVARAALLGEFDVPELARVIRPLIGLTPRESGAVLNYWNHLRTRGMEAAAAQGLASQYAGKLHRARALRIARTEMAFAYNEGVDLAVKQAQLGGFVGGATRVWITADDERVCPVCKPLDGVAIGEGGVFPGDIKLPPAHPLCRCAIAYDFETGAAPPLFPSDIEPVPPASFDLTPTEDERMLLEGDVEIVDDMSYGVSRTLEGEIDGTSVVVKPQSGLPNSWIREGIVPGSEISNERAAYLMNRILGEPVRMPTLVLRDTPEGLASVQRFIESQGNVGWFGFEAVDHTELHRLAIFDTAIGNLDRHGGNALVDLDGHLVAIDHGLAFPGDGWEGGNLDAIIAANRVGVSALSSDEIKQLAGILRAWPSVEAALRDLLRSESLAGARARVRFLVEEGRIPTIDEWYDEAWF